MEIRIAAIEDVTAIAKIQYTDWNTTFAAFTPADYIAKFPYEYFVKGWTLFMEERMGDTVMWVIEDPETDVVGYVAAKPCIDQPYDAELTHISLLPEYQRRGLGKRLFFHVVEWVLSKGKNSMFLGVFSDNPATGFYEHLQGECVAERETDVSGKVQGQRDYAWSDLSSLVQLRRHTAT